MTTPHAVQASAVQASAVQNTALFAAVPAQAVAPTQAAISNTAVINLPAPRDTNRVIDLTDSALESSNTESGPVESRILVERVQAGDNAAFGELYARYSPIVMRFVSARVNNRTLAEDITSDTFVRAMRRIETFTWQGRDIGSWLVTIARNLVSDHFASAHSRRELATEDVNDAGPIQLVEGPEDVIVRSSEQARIRAAVALLGAEQRACVEARFLQGLSVSETADLLGRNDGAVRALQYRALRSLANLLPREAEFAA
jgi:RNA polymerase sigma-70 factor (ECF subfamily)